MDDLVIVEGVAYARFRVTFRLADGRRRRWTRWSPEAGAWARAEAARELQATFGDTGVKPGSVRIERV